MSSPLLRRGCAALTSIALAGSVALLVPASAEAATAQRAYGGASYGSTAKLGTTVNLGRTASQPLCTTKAGVSYSNNSAEVDVPGLGTIGAQVTKVQSKRSGSTQSSTTTTTTAGVDLLDGLVQADAISVTAKMVFRGGKYEREASTKFVGLRVNGVTVPDQTPAPNRVITIPLVGRVRLNVQTPSDDFKNHSITANALRIEVDADLDGPLPGIPGLPGTPDIPGNGLVSIAYAQASLSSPNFARASGNAYATQVRAGSLAKSGPTAIVYLPCGGTGGGTRTNNIANLAGLPGPLNGVLNAGAAKTTGKSTDSASAGTNATTTASIADVELLDGLITVDAVTAKASTTRKGSAVTRSSAGTKIVGLRISGTTRSVGTGENQRISVPGVGNLYLNRNIRETSGLQVYALQLELTQAFEGLPDGTTINVGAAKAVVTTT